MAAGTLAPRAGGSPRATDDRHRPPTPRASGRDARQPRASRGSAARGRRAARAGVDAPLNDEHVSSGRSLVEPRGDLVGALAVAGADGETKARVDRRRRRGPADRGIVVPGRARRDRVPDCGHVDLSASGAHDQGMSLYHDASRGWQDRFDTRRLADRIEDRLVHDAINPDDGAFIAARDMFFLATADEEGFPTC